MSDLTPIREAVQLYDNDPSVRFSLNTCGVAVKVIGQHSETSVTVPWIDLVSAKINLLIATVERLRK